MKTLVVLLSFLSLSAIADDFKLSNITTGELDDITKELSANFIHRSVSPAGTLGDIWGVEVGVLGGLTDTPDLEKLVKRADPSLDIGQIPHAAILARVSVPYSITFEANYLPEIDASNAKLSSWSAAVMWTASDFMEESILPFEFDLAFKAHYSKAEFSYVQNFSTEGVDGEITFDDSIWGLMGLFSSKVLFMEPYVGLGYLSADAETAVSATVNVSFFSDSALTKQNSDPTSFHGLAGIEFSAFFMNLGLEAGYAFGTTSYTAKLSFAF